MLRPTTLLLRTSTLLLAVVLVLGFVLGLAWLLTAQRHAETNQQALQTLQQQTLRLAHLDTLLVRRAGYRSAALDVLQQTLLVNKVSA